jgi:TRAP-type C4-dicarboxylate transport system permease small subunit
MEVLNNFLIKVAEQIVNPLILLLIAVAGILFAWGVFTFIANAGETEARSQGQKAILWGIVGLAIMFGAYGILNVGTATFGIKQVQPGFLHQPPTR